VVFGDFERAGPAPVNVLRRKPLWSPARRAVGLLPVISQIMLIWRDRKPQLWNGLASWNISAAGLDTGEKSSSSLDYEVSGNYLTYWAFSHILDGHSRLRLSMARTVLRYICSHTRIGITHFQDDRGVVGRVI